MCRAESETNDDVVSKNLVAAADASASTMDTCVGTGAVKCATIISKSARCTVVFIVRMSASDTPSDNAMPFTEPDGPMYTMRRGAAPRLRGFCLAYALSCLQTTSTGVNRLASRPTI